LALDFELNDIESVVGKPAITVPGHVGETLLVVVHVGNVAGRAYGGQVRGWGRGGYMYPLESIVTSVEDQNYASSKCRAAPPILSMKSSEARIPSS